MKQVYTTNEIKAKLQPIFNANSIERAILFGSYAKGQPTPSSDIDIVIDSSGRIKGIDFFGVLEDMVEALEKPVDLFEASQIIRGSKVSHEIEKTGVIIYERA